MFEKSAARVALSAVLAAACATTLTTSATGAPGHEARPRPARWALATSTEPAQVAVYAIAPESGALTPHSTAAAEGVPASVVVHPTGRFAYVAARGTRTVQAFRFDATAGTLVAIGSFPVPGASSNPYAVAVEPLGRFLYVTSPVSDTIAGFWIHPLSGRLSLLPAFPIATGAAPHEMVFDPIGRLAFVGNWRDSGISAYRIAWNGRLMPVPGSPFPTLPRPEGLALHPSGRLLYAAHGDGGGLSAFRVERGGTLAPVAGSPFRLGLDPFGLATSVDGRTLYAAEPFAEVVLMRRIDAATGAVSDLPPSRVPAGNNVRQVRVDPSGRFVYVTAAFPGALFAFATDAEGRLTPIEGSPFPLAPGEGGLALVR